MIKLLQIVIGFLGIAFLGILVNKLLIKVGLLEDYDGEQMNKRDLIEKLKKLQECIDKERAHSDADKFLLEYVGDEKVTEAFEKIEKWYA